MRARVSGQKDLTVLCCSRVRKKGGREGGRAGGNALVGGLAELPLLVVEVLFEFVDLAFQDLVLGAVPFDVLCRALCLLQLLLCLFEVGFEVGDAVLERDDLLVFGHQLVLELLVGCLGPVGSKTTRFGGGGERGWSASVSIPADVIPCVTSSSDAFLTRCSRRGWHAAAEVGRERERGSDSTDSSARVAFWSASLRSEARRYGSNPSVSPSRSRSTRHAEWVCAVRCVRVDDGVVFAHLFDLVLRASNGAGVVRLLACTR